MNSSCDLADFVYHGANQQPAPAVRSWCVKSVSLGRGSVDPGRSDGKSEGNFRKGIFGREERMKSCHLRLLSCLFFASVVVGCVPYAVHENVVIEKDRLRKMHDDLRAKYNRLLQQLNISDPEQVALLQKLLAGKEQIIGDLKNQLDRLKFDEFDVAPGVTVGPRGQLILSDLLFRSGSADIGKDGRGALDQLATVLKTKYAGETFHLIGHTDTDPIKNSRWETNLNLGLKRANQVFKYLFLEHGLKETQFRISSYGTLDPVAANDTKANKARNRRVEVFRGGAEF